MESTKANELKVKDIVIIDGKRCKIEEMTRVKPGKGPAFFQMELIDLDTGKKVNHRVCTSDSISKIYLENKRVQILYSEPNEVICIDIDNQEEISIPKETFSSEQWKFVNYCNNLILTLDENKQCMSVNFIDEIKLKIKMVDPYMKRSSSKQPEKLAVLEGDINVYVPQHLENDDEILVDPNTAEFIKRV